jgi:hypothetical protein
MICNAARFPAHFSDEQELDSYRAKQGSQCRFLIGNGGVAEGIADCIEASCGGPAQIALFLRGIGNGKSMDEEATFPNEYARASRLKIPDKACAFSPSQSSAGRFAPA